MSKRFGTELSAILLAAGQSQRFGSPKLLHPLADGTPLGLVAAQKLLKIFEQVVVVINPNSPKLAKLYQALGAQVVINPHDEQGLGLSLATCVAYSSLAEGWLIALADMPFIQPETYRSVATALIQGARIAAPTYHNKRGHPVGFANCFKQELLELNQDVGANHLLKKYAAQIHLIPIQDAGILQDIDTPNDLMRFPQAE